MAERRRIVPDNSVLALAVLNVDDGKVFTLEKDDFYSVGKRNKGTT
jgi:hypothetical protein